MIFLGSLLLFWVNIQAIELPVFDEAHYVPAAKALLAGQVDARTEHPPLGKMLVALGIPLGGDRAFGWRLMSAIFGSLTLVGMYLWAHAIFQRQDSALVTTLTAAFNQLLFVQSRIAMLDGFMFTFVVWGFLTLSFRTDKALLWSGVLFGLAVSCKWFAVVPLAMGIGLGLAMRAFSMRTLAISLGVVPVASYFAVFLVYWIVIGMPENILYLLTAQSDMWDAQHRVPDTHPYMSSWYTWPFILRPIWYSFESGGEGRFRGILHIGNPLIMWSGLLAIAYCGWLFVKRQSRNALLILFLYFGFLLSWAVIPRKLSFYYYYFPAGMILSLAIGLYFHRHPKGRWIFVSASALVFSFFYPVISGIAVPIQKLPLWLWMKSWI